MSTNFKLGVQREDEDPYRRDGPSPARSKVKIAMSRGASDRCWPISLQEGWLSPTERAAVSAHFGLPCVRPWDNRGKCYMDGKRI